jgi:tRNA1(Val) A37 N6-methylase TrmN6
MRASGPKTDPDITADSLLGGRLRLRQPRRGHRFGHDAVLLAAATNGRKGQHAVDLGAGVGAAGLALAARVQGLRVTLVEVAPELTALAAENARDNGLSDRVRAVVLDVAAAPRSFAAHGLAAGSADHVLMNPPFNDPARQRLSPDPQRRLAHAAARETLCEWIKAATRILRMHGELSLIWRADGLGDVLATIERDFGAVVVLPVYGRPNAPAIRVLVRAGKGSRAPLALMPGLTLNDAAGRPTPEAEAVLRGGAALPLKY